MDRQTTERQGKAMAAGPVTPVTPCDIADVTPFSLEYGLRAKWALWDLVSCCVTPLILKDRVVSLIFIVAVAGR